MFFNSTGKGDWILQELKSLVRHVCYLSEYITELKDRQGQINDQQKRIEVEVLPNISVSIRK